MELELREHPDSKGLTGIGGHDIWRIAQGDAWTVWAEKLGKIEKEDLSRVLPVQLGNFLEPFICDWFRKTYADERDLHLETSKPTWWVNNEKVRVHTAKAGHWMLISNETPWALYAPDGFVWKTIDDPWALFDAKSVNQYTKLDDAVMKYLPQMTWGMGLIGLERAYLAVLIGTLGFEVVELEFDQDFYFQLYDMAFDLWGHVLAGTEPPQGKPVAAKPKIAGHVTYTASQMPFANQWHSYEVDYLENENAAKLFDLAKKHLKALVPDDAKEVVGTDLRIVRSKNGSLTFKKEK